MKKTKTFWVDIYVGTKDGYDGYPPYQSRESLLQKIVDICQHYTDEVGLGVTVNPTTFVYKDGSEHGARVGLINYARFPSDPKAILKHAIRLAKLLRKHMHQERVTVMTPTESIMIGAD